MTDVIDRIKSILEESRLAGENQLANGTRLVAPAPEIGPKAWYHLVFAALNDDQLNIIQQELRQKLPQQLVNFFKQFNGISMFGNELEIWGKRTSYARTGDDVWQPFDIVGHNRPNERPTGSPYSVVYFASTNCGEKRIYFDSIQETIGKTDRHDYRPEKVWKDFDAWLLEELDRHNSMSD